MPERKTPKDERTDMNEAQDRIKSIRMEHPDRIPLEAGVLPAVWMKYGKEFHEIVRRHPLVFHGQGPEDGAYAETATGRYVEGEYVDAWGCVWSNIKTGMHAIVTGHPLPTREAVRSLRIPEQDDNLPHGFMWLRLADMRGFDEIMIDFAEEPPELQMLIDKVLEYDLRQVKRKLEALSEPGQIVYLGDDLGMQNSLAISPEKWRKYLKPCFVAIFKPFRAAGHHVYLHTDGHILEIIPDLVDCGVSIVNPQVGANDLDQLARICRGRVCVDLDLNRQKFPFWTPSEIDAHIREAVEKLGSPEGGLWLKAEIGEDVPLENVEAICCAMEKYSLRFSA